MPKRLRLNDLFVIGRELTVTAPEGEVTVWLQKINMADQEEIYRKARASSATLLMARDDPDSEDWQAAYAEVVAIGAREYLVAYAIAEDLAKRELVIEAELGGEERWTDDDVLQAARDAWRPADGSPGLEARWLEDPDDPEAKAIHDVLRSFGDEVAEALEQARAELTADWEGRSLTELREECVRHYLSARADAVFVREYTRCELWKATRSAENHAEAYFESRAEVETLSQDAFMRLATAYRELSVDVMEGKDSAETPPSSSQSEQPEKAEATSGPLAAVR